MSVASDILDNCVTLTTSYVNLSGDSGAPSIKSDQVVSVSYPLHRDDDRGLFDVVPKPCIVFSLAGVSEPAKGGDNKYALAFYTILMQLLDNAIAFGNDARLTSRLRWEYELRRLFAQGNLRNAVASTQFLTNCFHTGTDTVPSRGQFNLFNDCIFALSMQFKVWEPHDTDGRT